jgi:hypothetical protein
MSSKEIAKDDKERIGLIRLAALALFAAFCGLMLLAGNDLFNDGVEGAIYYVSWSMIILGIPTGMTSGSGYIALVNEHRSRKNC